MDFTSFHAHSLNVPLRRPSIVPSTGTYIESASYTGSSFYKNALIVIYYLQLFNFSCHCHCYNNE
jgi:hypothetical protein